MTNPDVATILRNMKVPEPMSGSQELRTYLISYIERGDSEPDPAEQHKLNWLLVISHPEVVNALGGAGRADQLGSVQKSSRPT